MATTVQNCLDRAWIKARDEGVTKRWASSEGVMWASDAQREIVSLVPSANATRTIVAAVAGTRQTLAGLGLSGTKFIDIPRNMEADGVTPGSALTPIPRVWLDERRRGWHRESAAEAQHWTQDENDPTAAYIYPAKTGGKLEVIYAKVPAVLTSANDLLELSDIYANAVQDYILACFFLKDAEHAKSNALAGFYAQSFGQRLGVNRTSLTKVNRDTAVNAAGGTP